MRNTTVPAHPMEKIRERAKKISIAHGYVSTLRHCISSTMNDIRHTKHLLEMIAEMDNDITRQIDLLMTCIDYET